MLAEKIVFPHADCPVSVVHWRQTVDPRYAPAYHRAFEAHLIRQGHGVYMISGEHFTFQSNSLIVIHRVLGQPSGALLQSVHRHGYQAIHPASPRP